ncbi:50S ribosomal protein L13 [Candidatus Woesearchaeota archaeon]|nr:50S ribosomal protein L13 [Candidatus Woesearchaeota archaeon]
MIVEAKDAILGRLSSFVAKQALLGNKVHVINCEECVVSGKKQAILGVYKTKLHRKAPGKAPFFYKKPDLLVKRTIRGMLPFKMARGREAFKNVKCYVGIPDNLINEKPIVMENSEAKKLQSTDYIKVRDICRAVGGK